MAEAQGTAVLNTAKLIAVIKQAVKDAVETESRIIEQDAKRLAPVRKVFNSTMLGKMTRTRQRRRIVGISSTQLNAEAAIRDRLGLGPRTVNIAGNRAAALSVMREPNSYRQVVRRTLASEMLDATWYSTLSHQQRRSKRSGKRLRQLAEADLRLIGPRRNEKGELVLQKNAGRYLTARGRYELEHAEKRGAISASESIEVTPSGELRTKSTEIRLGGRLRSEIKALPVETDGNAFTGRVVSPTAYAKYVEFGTHHAAAQPYLRPAANLARRRFRKTLQRTLDSVGRNWRS